MTEQGVKAEDDDLKLVVSIRSGIATVGVQRPDTDPHFESFARMKLAEILPEVMGVFDRATAKWSEQPRNPAHEGAAQSASASRPAPQTSDEDERPEQKQATLF